MLSVIVRSKDDADRIGRTLQRIRSATVEPVEIIGLDSGSRDATLGLQALFADRLFQLPAERYLPGGVLNFGVQQARGDVVVFLNSDCIPLSDAWLDCLVRPILAGEAEVTFGRQDPRPDAWELVRKDNARAFGDGGVSSGWDHFFSLAVSAFRRDLLLEHPFPVDVTYSEDVAWSEAVRGRARVVYVPEARVEHSHNYSLPQLWRRFRGEGAADARIFPRDRAPNRWLPRALVSSGVEIARDWAWCLPRRAWRDVPRAIPYRLAQRLGYWWGSHYGPAAGGPRPLPPGDHDWAKRLEIEELDPLKISRRCA